MSHLRTRRAFIGHLAAAPLGIRTLSRRSPSALTFFVGTYTDGASEGIYRCRMDPGSGELELLDATGGIPNPSFLAIHPTEPYLYAVSETTDFRGGESGGVFAYAVDPHTRRLQELNAQPSHGGAPCYVSVTPNGRLVLVANYVGGNVAVFPVLDDGRLGEAASVEQHEGKSVNEQRQESPHAHCILPDPPGTHALAVDLGIDQVVMYRLDGGRLSRAGSAALQPGAGPRHVIFDPEGAYAYVINELDSTITSFRYEAGSMEATYTTTTLPEEFQGENYCADIHVSTDGRFVYGSNRGHDSIVVFAAGDEGRLTTVQHIPTGGSWPRNFAIDPSGRFLLAANQRSDNVVVFTVDRATGRLDGTGHELSIPSPVCIRFL